MRTEFAKKVYEDCCLLFKGGLCTLKGPLLLCSQLVNQATQFVGRRFGGHWKQEDWPLMIFQTHITFGLATGVRGPVLPKLVLCLLCLPQVAGELWASKCPRDHEGDEAQHMQVEVPQAISQFHVE